MSRTYAQATAFVGAFTTPVVALAAGYQPIVVKVNAGFAVTFESVFQGLINVLLMWAMPIAITIFAFGAFRMAASRGVDDEISKGKSIMKGALIGFAIIAGSYLILSSVVYIIAGS